MQLSFVVLAAALFATAHGLVTPLHGGHFGRRHASIAKARAPIPEPEPVAAPVESKRSLRKRCKPRTSPGTLSIPAGVGNVATDPAGGGIGATLGLPTTAPPPPPPPKTSDQPPPSPTSSSDPQPSSGGGGGGGGGPGSHTGDATFYNTGLTACGIQNNDGQKIAAVSELLFDGFEGYTGGNPNQNPICGRKARVYYNGNTETVTITDRCTACKKYDLDFTPSVFQTIFGDLGLGRVPGMTWDLLPAGS